MSENQTSGEGHACVPLPGDAVFDVAAQAYGRVADPELLPSGWTASGAVIVAGLDGGEPSLWQAEPQVLHLAAEHDDGQGAAVTRPWLHVGARVHDGESGRVGVVILFRGSDGSVTGQPPAGVDGWVVLRPESGRSRLGRRPWRTPVDSVRRWVPYDNSSGRV